MAKPPYPLHPEPVTKSWLERNPAWKIPLGFLIFVGLLAAYGTIVAVIVTGSIRHSVPYKRAMALASVNPEVRDAIGEPFEADWLVSGGIHTNGGTGSANFLVPITGLRGRGRIRVVAHKTDGVWRFTCLQVEVSGRGDSIDLLAAASRE